MNKFQNESYEPSNTDGAASQAVKLSSYLILYGVVILGFISCMTGYGPGALGALAFLLVGTTKALAKRFGLLETVVGLFSAWMLLAILIGVWGQYFTFAKIPGSLAALLVFGLLTIQKVDTRAITRKTYRAELIIGSLVFLSIIAIDQIAAQHIITFLGYGYDNSAHVASVREVVTDRAFFTGQMQPEKFVSFLGSTPQGPAGAVSLLADVSGVSGQNLASLLRIFLTATLLIPVATVTFCFIALQQQSKSFLKALVFTTLIAVVCAIGYPSHMWFSGFLSSNLATLVLLMGTALFILGQETSTKVFLLLLLVVIQSFIYLLYTPPLVLFLIILLLKIAMEKQSLKSEVFRILCSPRILSLLAVSFALVVIAIKGIFSQYGTNQFLAPGGIEPLPVATTFFIFGATLFLVSNLKNHSIVLQSISVASITLVSIACAGVAYSVWRTGLIMYYPTKLATSVFVIVLFLFSLRLNQNIKLESIAKTVALQIFIASMVISYIGLNPTIFKTAYMGSGKGVLSALKEGRAEVVDGSIVLALTKVADGYNRPILELFPERDSELNTRWINLLAGQWTDASWISWTKIRTLILENKVAEAAEEIKRTKIIVASRDEVLIKKLDTLAINEINCLVNINDEINCQGS
jgi:hypothetical protein